MKIEKVDDMQEEGSESAPIFASRLTPPASRFAGFYTLFSKEWLRFWKVSVQTVLAPVLTALLYLLVFAHTLKDHVEVFPGVSYTAFLIPGLAMMSVLQNSFANSSSSLMQSKMQGNIIFVLLPPLSYRDFFLAYLLAAVARGMVVGTVMFAVTFWFVDLPLAHPLWALAFGLLGSGVMGALGILAGIRSDKVDQLAASRISSSCRSRFFPACSTRSVPSPRSGRPCPTSIRSSI